MTIEEDTLRDFPELMSTIENAHKGLLILANKLSDKSFEEKSRKVGMILILYSDIVETIKAALSLCISGYYEASIKLLRSCFEGSFMLRKLNSYPEESFVVDNEILQQVFNEDVMKVQRNYDNLNAEDKKRFEINLWLDKNEECNENKIRLLMKIFSPTRIIRDFSFDSDYRENLRAYHQLSQFSHPFFTGLISRIRIKDYHTKIEPCYIKKYAEYILKNILRATVICSTCIKDTIPDPKLSKEESELFYNVGKSYDKLG